LLDLAGDLVEEGVLAGGQHLDEERPRPVDAATDHLVAGLDAHAAADLEFVDFDLPPPGLCRNFE